jgi:DNA (cytosine-5)-methyltransferase 1
MGVFVTASFTPPATDTPFHSGNIPRDLGGGQVTKPNSVEICAGGGGQALGIELGGFEHSALVEIDQHSCSTLRSNRPTWNVIQDDVRSFSGLLYTGIELLAGGVPCPPFSKAGKQLGNHDERDLFPEAVRLIDEMRPKAVMLENVRGLLDAVFDDYRSKLVKQVRKLGYESDWRLLNASDFGVSQLRPRVVFVAFKKEIARHFEWPVPGMSGPPKTVGQLLRDLMAERGWRHVEHWVARASEIAPTIVGGSMKHGGPDLGPTRAKRAWAALGVNAHTLADEAPDRDFVGMPRLTVQMVARIQGFPDTWHFEGKKTPAYRQVGNAFPPPVAAAVAGRVCAALNAVSKRRITRVAA